MPPRVRLRRHRWILPAAVAACIGASNTARAEQSTDTFVGSDDVRRPFTATYREGYRPGRREPHYFRAAAELSALLAIGTAMYFVPRDRFDEHNEYANAGERFWRLRAAFDTNEFNINAVGHPAAGTLYHLFARTSGHGLGVSFAYSFVASFLWEMALEFPEKPSINDTVITPVSGVSIGEFLVHAGDYFNSTPGNPRWYHEVLGFVLGPSHRLNRALDGYQRPAANLPPDRLGYSSYYSHRFDVLAGPMGVVNNEGNSGTGGQVRVNAEIIAVPGLLRPGRFAVNFTDANFVALLAQVSFGKDAEAYDVVVDANLFGRYSQKITNERSGIASMFAFNTSVRYANRFFLDRRDNYFVTHLGGPAVKLWALRGDWLARFDGVAHLDFGAVRSLVFPDHRALYGDASTATVLNQHGYYFGFGASAVARGTISYKWLELGSRVFLGRYESIDWGDRYIAETGRAIHTSDTLAEFEWWAGLLPRTVPLQLRAFIEQIPRTSRMLSLTTHRFDRRYGITIGGLF